MMFEQVVNEMKRQPFTMILVLGLWAGFGIIWSNYAPAGELVALKAQIHEVYYVVQKGQLETQLRSIEAELFRLRRAADEAREKGHALDSIYYTRIQQLESDYGAVNRALADLKRAGR